MYVGEKRGRTRNGHGRNIRKVKGAGRYGDGRDGHNRDGKRRVGNGRNGACIEKIKSHTQDPRSYAGVGEFN